jgi:hypothetical protein
MKESEGDQYPGSLGFKSGLLDFHLAVRQAAGTVHETHQVVEFLQMPALDALQIKPERLGIFDSAPETISIAVFVAENRVIFGRKIGPQAVAMKAFLENNKTELNVGHFPPMLTCGHGHLLQALIWLWGYLVIGRFQGAMLRSIRRIFNTFPATLFESPNPPDSRYKVDCFGLTQQYNQITKASQLYLISKIRFRLNSAGRSQFSFGCRKNLVYT